MLTVLFLNAYLHVYTVACIYLHVYICIYIRSHVYMVACIYGRMYISACIYGHSRDSGSPLSPNACIRRVCVSVHVVVTLELQALGKGLMFNL